MEERIISFETAKLADEKGFSAGEQWRDELYTEDGKLHPYMAHWLCGHTEFYNAPTQGILQKWLKDKHGIDVYVLPETYSDQPNVIKYSVGYIRDVGICLRADRNNAFDTYEEALEIGLYKALNLIKL